MVDLGLNWYLNKFVKVYFDWEHAMFAQPVYYRPGPGSRRRATSSGSVLQIYTDRRCQPMPDLDRFRHSLDRQY